MPGGVAGAQPIMAAPMPIGNMPKGGKLEAGLACIAKSMMLI